MYGKIENENLIYAPETIIFNNGECICNPNVEQLIANGYKNIIEDIKVALGDNEYYSQSYTENETEITIHFNIIKIEAIIND
jgi:hypothetical protein